MPGQPEQLSEQVRQHGLEQRLIRDGIRFDEEPFTEAFPRWLANPQLCADSVARVAERCVADGADVIVLGCAGTCALCSKVGFHKIEVDAQEVPIVDSVMIAMKMAETAVDLRSATGLPIPSRTRNYVLPAQQDWKRVRGAFGLEE
jgi:allantoin racemase